MKILSHRGHGYQRRVETRAAKIVWRYLKIIQVQLPLIQPFLDPKQQVLVRPFLKTEDKAIKETEGLSTQRYSQSPMCYYSSLCV